MDGLLLPASGFVCGSLAGAAAQYGPLCTIGAIEDALVAGDLRRARAWALAAAIAMLLTQTLVFSGYLDLGATHYVQSRLDLFGLVIGGLLFGLGAALVGTCAFGALVRAGTGDLRAMVSALILGLAAFAATGGILSSTRSWLSEVAVIDTAPFGVKTVTGIAAAYLGQPAAMLCAFGIPAALLLFGLASGRLYHRPACGRGRDGPRGRGRLAGNRRAWRSLHRHARCRSPLRSRCWPWWPAHAWAYRI